MDVIRRLAFLAVAALCLSSRLNAAPPPPRAVAPGVSRILADAPPLVFFAISSDGTRLAGLAEGGELQLWDLASRKLVCKNQLGDTGVASEQWATFSRNGAFIAAGAVDAAEVFRASDCKQVVDEHSKASALDHARGGFSPDSKTIAIRRGEHQIVLIDLQGGAQKVIDAPDIEAGPRFDRRGKLWYGDFVQAIRALDLRTGRATAALAGRVFELPSQTDLILGCTWADFARGSGRFGSQDPPWVDDRRGSCRVWNTEASQP